MKDFKDKVAVVTGAASGIGRGMVENFVDAGMKVVLADIDGEKLGNTVQQLKEAGASVVGVEMDVSKPAEGEAVARRTLDEFGAVHALCNNAGVGCGGRSTWETPMVRMELGPGREPDGRGPRHCFLHANSAGAGNRSPRGQHRIRSCFLRVFRGYS